MIRKKKKLNLNSVSRAGYIFIPVFCKQSFLANIFKNNIPTFIYLTQQLTLQNIKQLAKG